MKNRKQEGPMKILVTGGGGFLGKSLVKELVRLGYNVKNFSRRDCSELRELGVEVVRGDISDKDAVNNACKGCDAVFHVAAKAGVWGSYKEYYNTNILGTMNVISACRKNNVSKLIFTSSPSVVFHGSDQQGVNENEEYPKKFLSNYPKTKAMAEKLVLEANSGRLATVALRPHLIWGPGDNHLVPRIITRAGSGKLRIVGDGENIVDTVYIDNAVDAHILALERLRIGSKISGKSYFITNGEPLSMATIINKILDAADLPHVKKNIPAGAAYIAGALMELAYAISGRRNEPLMTRFVAKELSTSHWFDISAARRDLGYEPRVSIDEGMNRLSRWLKEENEKNEAVQ